MLKEYEKDYKPNPSCPICTGEMDHYRNVGFRCDSCSDYGNRFAFEYANWSSRFDYAKIYIGMGQTEAEGYARKAFAS